MENKEILQDVQSIFREITDNPSTVLTPATIADDVEEWDSLVHVQLLVAIEEKYNISFSADQIGTFVNVGQMCDAIEVAVSKK